jgi:hypothetical protein
MGDKSPYEQVNNTIWVIWKDQCEELEDDLLSAYPMCKVTSITLDRCRAQRN